MDEQKTGNLLYFLTAMIALWKWVHRKEPIHKKGTYFREGKEIEISEGGFSDSEILEKELEKKL